MAESIGYWRHNMKKAIIDITTGQTEYVDMTQDEIANYEAYKTKADAEVETNLQARIEATAQRQALLAKLGITEDEARLLLGGN
jgi:hypothetical protein